MTAFIVGCLIGFVVFCAICPPIAWAVGGAVTIVVAFAGNVRG